MRHAATETHAKKVSLRELHLEEFLQHDEILLHRQFTDIYRYTDRIHIYTDTRLFTDIQIHRSYIQVHRSHTARTYIPATVCTAPLVCDHLDMYSTYTGQGWVFVFFIGS